MFLHNINISHFRCYDAARITLKTPDSLTPHMVVISGENGAGKTNILEAISLLSPGKGLRNADLEEMKNRSAKEDDIWAISAEVEDSNGNRIRIGTGLDRKVKKRVVRINGRTAKNQSELSEIISAIWLTPQMDGLFIEGAAARRHFVDRLVFAYDPTHVSRVNRYDKKMRERLKLLQMPGNIDQNWISTIEKQLAGEAVSIAAARDDLINHLQQHANSLSGITPLFPTPVLKLNGWIAEEIGSTPAIEIEEKLKAKLKASRGLDREARRTHEGTHRSDLEVTYQEKNMPAAQCSTGEQKALLVSIILAHALMMQAEKGFIPLILLDEVAAHLDSERRKQLFAILCSLNGQIFLTGTDENIFEPLKNRAKFLKITQGRIN